MLREVWPGANIEEVPAVRRGWFTAPRVVFAFAIQPTVEYAITDIQHEREEGNNGMKQAVKVRLAGRMTMTGAYLSHKIYMAAFTNFLT